jgi:uncharacterized protein
MFENKRKIVNDPVHGFINIPDELIFDIIEHPYFQRLRRINQLGLTHLVYPGALHTRFHHALGSMHLMSMAIETLRYKGFEITDEEEQGALIAILLHDIGHGPYSHGLEYSLVFGMSHEELTSIYLQQLNKTFDNKLSVAIEIFQNSYRKKFLHQLVSSQLDMDRLDYLKRDSFYTGVSEGVINSDRIIKMLNIADDQLVIESKGIYSIEKFIIARRLMYWQVYFHKTVLSAEYLLIKILQRARELAESGKDMFFTPALKPFLANRFTNKDFENDSLLNNYSLIDDFDIMTCIKVWVNDNDKILSLLSANLVNRKLYKIELQNQPFTDEDIKIKKEKALNQLMAYDLRLTTAEIDYFVFTDNIKNNPYTPLIDKINILYKNGEVKDITEASDQLNVQVLSKTVTKYFICYPKEITF